MKVDLNYYFIRIMAFYQFCVLVLEFIGFSIINNFCIYFSFIIFLAYFLNNLIVIYRKNRHLLFFSSCFINSSQNVVMYTSYSNRVGEN